jgi:hypothetical protein
MKDGRLTAHALSMALHKARERVVVIGGRALRLKSRTATGRCSSRRRSGRRRSPSTERRTRHEPLGNEISS